MSFSQEMKDFLTGYQTMQAIGQKKKEGERADKKTDADIEYQNARIEIERAGLDIKRQQLGAASSRAGAAAGAAAARQSLAERRFALDQEKFARQKELDDAAAARASATDGRADNADRRAENADRRAAVSSDAASAKDQEALAKAQEAKANADANAAIAGFDQSAYDDGYGDDSYPTESDMMGGEDPYGADLILPPPPAGYDGAAEDTYDDSEVSAYAAGGLVGADKAPPRLTPSVLPLDPADDPAPALPDSTASGGRPSALPAVGAPDAPVAPAAGPASSPVAALPAGDEAPASAATPGAPQEPQKPDEEAKQSLPLKATRIIVDRAAKAATAAADAMERQYNTAPAAIGEGSETPEVDFVNGKGGLSYEELEAARKVVDPNNTIPGYLKSAMTLSSVYDYFMQRGETEKATTAAMKYLTTERQMTRALGTLSLQAMQDGHVQEACKLFNDACNRFPSGYEIKIQPDDKGVLTYTVSNDQRTVEEGKINAEQFMQFGGKVADGSLYSQSLMQFVAENKPKPKPDVAAGLDGVSTAFSDYSAKRKAYEASGSVEDYKALETAHGGYMKARAAAMKAGVAAAGPKADRTATTLAVARAIDSTLRRDDGLPAAPAAEEKSGGILSAIGGMFSGSRGDDGAGARGGSALPTPTATPAPAAVAATEEKPDPLGLR